MKNKNAVVMATSSGCECDTWMLVMTKLKQQTGIHPRYFIYYDSDKLESGKEHFLNSVGNNVFFHNEFDNYKGRGYYDAPKVNVLDDVLLNNISRYELIALRMMDRFDPMSDAFSFTDRQYYFRELLLRWLDIIDDLEIEIFISPDVPHRVSDYALYVACLVKDIDFIYFDLTPFGDASLINDDIDDYQESRFLLPTNGQLNEQKKALIQDKMNKYRGKKENYKLWYMENQVKSASISKPQKAIRKLKNLKHKGVFHHPKKVYDNWFKQEVFSFYVKPNTMPYNSRFNRFQKRVADYNTSKTSKSYRSIYESLVQNVDLESTKYVIFALHHQPEATTSPSGGVYVDQLLVIDMLDRLLPSDITVLVKDHSSQFLGVLESPSAGRSQIFYDKLAQFSDRVKMVALDINSFDLIDNAQAVVTVTGTIGIESLARKTPVFCFGRTWYQNCPGAFRIKNKTDLLAAWDSINSDTFYISQSQVEQYVNQAATHFIWGLHSGAFKKISSRSQKDTVNNIVSGIICYLESKHII